MKIGKMVQFTREDIQTMVEFRLEIFHPMCDILENQCELCPFGQACSDIEEFLDEAITHSYWDVPQKEE